MRVKAQIIRIFEQNKGTYISGEEIAKKLSVSRNAVWKAVKALQKDGYDITAVTNKGYCLSEKTDVLSAAEIERFLGDKASFFYLDVRHTVTSTNTIAKNLAGDGGREGVVVIADEQTEGKGRIGRRFFSPRGTGIYMSIILRPTLHASDSIMITTAAAVAVSRAISSVCNKDAKIKWVNDIYVDKRKVCGILTEAALNIESGGLDYAVLGIGINVYQPSEDFPDEIKNIATAICDEPNGDGDLRNRLCAKILEEISNIYYEIENHGFVNEYKERLFILGKKILVVGGNACREAIAVDIDEDCRLKVRFSDGEEKLLSSGEVSVKA